MSSSYIGKVLDNYRILDKLGIGGMGVVFKAIHIKLDKVFAIKIIAPGLAMNEHFIKRFQTEAKALAKFEDPNIVRIYDLRSADDQWFIVMEYVDGTTLTDKILKEGAFHWAEALPIIKQVLSAIGHAHEAGIIHRDIKPNNIMLNEKGTVKITDFGLAKDQTKTTNTMSVTSGGTLYYMSPEHVKGFSFIDARSDIYSIGMTFYEMLTGIVPFQNIKSDFDIRESIIRKEFAKPRSINPTIPAELEMIVMRSISKNPDDRYQTADDMMQAILDFETHYGITEKAGTDKKERTTEIPVVKKNSAKEESESVPAALAESVISRSKKLIMMVTGTVTATAIILLAVINSEFFFDSESDSERIPEEQIQPSLTISSRPASAWILLNGDSVGQTPLNSHRLQSGIYSLKIGKNSYESIDTTISLNTDKDLELIFTLLKTETKPVAVEAQRPAPTQLQKTVPVFAALSIESDPAGSELWLNGKMQGRTPLHLTEITPGSYLVELRKDGYEIHTQNLKLRVGNSQKIKAKLRPFSGGISVIKDPASATVLVDGKEKSSQNAPFVDINGIPIGKHLVEIASPGYVTFKQAIDLKRNEVYKINAQLVRSEGDLSIQIRPWGSIYINGALKKSSADIKYVVRLPVEQYDIKVEHPTLGIWQKAVELKGDEETNISVNFTQELPIRISAIDNQGNPLSGDIYVDGKQIGVVTPGEVLLRVGLHRIGVKKDGYNLEGGEKEVLIDQGINKSLVFTLEK